MEFTDMSGESLDMFGVFIENDGMKPDSAYYKRREHMGFKVRAGEKNDDGVYDVTPIVRRMGAEVGGGVIVQEGCVLTNSFSQASAVAALAKEYGIENVYIARVAVKPYVARKEDTAALSRLNEVYGRKGRPPAKRMWVINCLEEMQVYYQYASDAPICPGCGATNIKVRAGRPTCFVADEKQMATTRWYTTRFGNGFFEIPMSAEDVANWDAEKYNGITVECTDAPDLSEIDITNEFEFTLSASILCSSVARSVDWVVDDTDEQVTIIDALYISRAYTPKEVRDQFRQECFIKWVKTGGDPLAIRLDEPNEPDFIDVASTLGKDYAISLHRAYMADTLSASKSKKSQ